MTGLTTTLALLDEALERSEEAPLSVRRAMLVVMLLDALVDRVMRSRGADPLRERAGLAADAPALGLVLELAAHRDAGPRLVVESVGVPLADYDTLSTAEFMVSLYSGHVVPRLLVVLPDGSRIEAVAVLHAAARTAQALLGVDEKPGEV